MPRSKAPTLAQAGPTSLHIRGTPFLHEMASLLLVLQIECDTWK